MHYEILPTDIDRQEPSRETILSVCPAGVLESTVIVPSAVSAQPPLLALHGISRNAAELEQAFGEAAAQTGRIVVIPHFLADKWPVFQRITRCARPDRTLLALLSTLRSMDPVFHGRLDLFGFSGGAQLAHRFAMLYPEAIGNLHLGSAGWYTLPDAAATYPYGTATCADKPEPWSRLMRSGTDSFLRRGITVYVGDRDVTRDDSLRQNPIVDSQQGAHRLERARRYVAAIRDRQSDRGLPFAARLEVLPGCNHDFGTCASQGQIALRVLGQSQPTSI